MPNRLDQAAVDQKKHKGGAAKNVVLVQSYCTYTGNSKESWRRGHGSDDHRPSDHRRRTNSDSGNQPTR